jgi:hypothetical protein
LKSQLRRITEMITPPPATLKATLEHYGLSEVLSGFIRRQHIVRRVSWREFVQFVESQGYEIVTEDSNIYGRVGIRPAQTAKAPVMRMVTRSDVAAVHGSRRAY